MSLRKRTPRRAGFVVSLLLLLLGSSEVEASPTLTYKLTDLGVVGWHQNLTTTLNGQNVIMSSDGARAYAYTPSAPLTWTSTEGLQPSFGGTQGGPTDWGMRVNGISSGGYMNSNGLVAYTETTGLRGDSRSESASVGFMRKLEDGNWQPLTFASNASYSDGPYVISASNERLLQIAGINKSDLALVNQSFDLRWMRDPRAISLKV